MTLNHTITTIWRRWVLYLHGRWRQRKARCQVCGQWFDWEAPVSPGICPDCRRRYAGIPLARAQWLHRQRGQAERVEK
jgi:ribosomal protein L34E